MTTIRHPKCGKHFPHTSRAGHCPKCFGATTTATIRVRDTPNGDER